MSKTNNEKSITVEPDLEDVFPLPLRVAPEPWEDLASLLSRTAGEMGYEYVNWLLQPEGCAYSRLGPNVCFLLEDSAYQYLGHLLQLSKETLYSLTFHRFLLQMQAPEEICPSPKGYLQRPLFLLTSHVTHNLFLSQRASRVCPRCLAEEPAYDMLFWNIGPVVACLKHHIYLVDCCPHCQGKIPLLRSSLTHCPRCSADYRLAQTINLPEEPLFLSSQAMILAKLGVEEDYKGGRISTRLRPFLGKDMTEVTRECSYLTLDQAKKLLGVGHNTLKDLVSRGTLRAHITPADIKGLWLLEKSDVERLLEEWKDLISLSDVAQMYLGISREQVHALTKAELLLPARSRNASGWLTWYYKREQLERFEAELLRFANKALPPASKYVPLAKSGCISGLPLVETLKEILGGHLELIDTKREIPLFQRLVLSNKELKRILEENMRSERAKLNLLSTPEVMKSLGIGVVSLKVLVRQGVLISEGQVVKGKSYGRLFHREKVDSFRRNFILAQEAAELLDVSRTTINNYVSRGILHPVGLPQSRFYLREEVEALIPPDKLSIPKASPLLGMSY